MTSKGNILYVDDEQRNLDGFVHSFKDIYSIYVSKSTDEGLKLIKDKQIEVLIADLRMPDLSGFEFINQVKELNPNIICIVVTAYGDMSAVLDAISQGNIFRFILKPWDERDLQHTINNAIDLYRLKVQNENLILRLKKQNRKLRKANSEAKQSNRLISGFLANLNHELRTPMNGIIGFSELISHPEVTEERRCHYASIIKDNTYRLLTIVNSIIDLSRLEAGIVNISQGELDVNDLLNDIALFAESMISSKGLKLRVFTDLDQCIIFSDQFHIKRIINLLLDNSIKFTHTGKIELGYIVDNTEIVFYVKDTGKGIQRKQQQKIFESFFQEEFALIRQYEGLGVGLTIANHLIHLLGGKMWLKSELGKGSTFFFSLPCKTK